MKILAVASEGGHWIQLLRLKSAFEDAELVVVSTHKSSGKTNSSYQYYSVTDANRWDKMKLFKMAYQINSIIAREKPDYIISTGAAPGLAAILFGKVRGCKTIWIDSIANAERLSLSGRLIKPFTNLHLTQWPHLAKGRTLYRGTVIV